MENIILSLIHISHALTASYEDVQEGMSTPYGMARTTTLTLIPQGGYSGKKAFAEQAKQLAGPGVLMPVPDYLHAKQAFGVWSLPDRSTPFRARGDWEATSVLYMYLFVGKKLSLIHIFEQ